MKPRSTDPQRWALPQPRPPRLKMPDPSRRRISLADFGGRPGHTCVADALAKAALWLRAGGGRLVIPPGRYHVRRIAEGREHWLLDNIADAVIEAAGATIICHRIATGVRLRRCRRVMLQGLAVDWAMPMASLATVERRGRQLVLAYDDPRRCTLPVAGVTSWDDGAHSWAGDGHEWYHAAWGRSAGLPAASGGGLLLPPRPGDLARGDRVVVRHWIYHGNAVDFGGRGNADIHLEDVTVVSAPGHAFVGYGCDRGVRLTRCAIARGPQDLVSATADGCHVGACAGDVIIEDCDFAHQGDDSVNIHGVWMRVAEVVGSAVSLTSRWLDHARQQVARGHRLAFFREGTLEPLGERVIQAIASGPDALTVTLDRGIPGVEAGAFVADRARGTDRFRITGNHFHDHRARGMLIQARDGLIAGNRVERVQMAGLNLTTDCAFWQEGYGCADVLVSGNHFLSCNQHRRERGPRGVHLACVNVLVETPDGIGTHPLHERIALVGNVIEDTAGPAMLVASSRQVAVVGNRVARAQRAPLPDAGSAIGLPAAGHAALVHGPGTAEVCWLGNHVED